MILVPHVIVPVAPAVVPNVVVPASPMRPAPPPMHIMNRPMISNPPQVSPPASCGMPAYMCQGPCNSRAIGGTPAVQGEMPWNVG